MLFSFPPLHSSNLAEALVAAKGFVGEPCVDEERGYLPVGEVPEEVGPDFRLNEHDADDAELGERAPDDAAAVDGVINPEDARGELLVQLGHAGGGGGGDDELEVGHAGFERGDELGADVDFADAHGVK